MHILVMKNKCTTNISIVHTFKLLSFLDVTSLHFLWFDRNYHTPCFNGTLNRIAFRSPYYIFPKSKVITKIAKYLLWNGKFGLCIIWNVVICQFIVVYLCDFCYLFVFAQYIISASLFQYWFHIQLLYWVSNPLGLH